jgi:hypothetical protein
MELAEAMRLAAERGCDMAWDAQQQLWVIRAISYDSDACSLNNARLMRINRSEFLELFIPDRPFIHDPPG